MPEQPGVRRRCAFEDVEWSLPLGCSIKYKTWSIAQMAEWVYSVSGSEASRRIISIEEMDGHSMVDLLDYNVQVEQDFGVEPFQKLVKAAQIMINRAGYIHP